MSRIQGAMLAPLLLLCGCYGEASMAVFGPAQAADEEAVAPGEDVTGNRNDVPAVGVETGPTVDPVDTSLCSVPHARIWRLSHPQYDSSARALLQLGATTAASFEPDAKGSGFANAAETAWVSQTLAEQYQLSAEALAKSASLSALLPCSPADPSNQGCVEQFISDFGKRAFRAPLTAAQKSRYLALYQAGRTTSADAGVRMVIEAMLQSPYFLYRSELGAVSASSGTVKLTPFEVASELSYLLWNGPPDDALLAKAAAGELQTKASIEAEAQRMLLDARAKDVAWRYVDEYFDLASLPNLEKDTAVFPSFTAQLAVDLQSEAHAFTNEVIWNGSGKLSELLTANYSMLNARLATLYGVSNVTGDSLRKVQLDPGQRAGLLTHAGLLASLGSPTSSSPVMRGLFVRSRLLCQEISEPPPNVADTIEAPSTSKTTRQRYEAHLTNTSCSGCHSLMDPIGFGLENFDGLGRYRTTENNTTVDSAGALNAAGSITGAFNGPIELSKKLSAAPEVNNCVAKTFFRFAIGRANPAADACAVQAAQLSFSASGGELLGLAKATVTTDAFLYRVKP